MSFIVLHGHHKYDDEDDVLKELFLPYTDGNVGPGPSAASLGERDSYDECRSNSYD